MVAFQPSRADRQCDEQLRSDERPGFGRGRCPAHWPDTPPSNLCPNMAGAFLMRGRHAVPRVAHAPMNASEKSRTMMISVKLSCAALLFAAGSARADSPASRADF